ncbi:MAG: tetratricopeptide repeat protein [Reyranella sp.]|uniref:tetratricopeptide repeat protein n=1 Tax=Reyranella sp. TaxID=1929291 RepID=UPI0012231697|nr:tetratricopeptide repeat protein [Reyranella sp.]TAJ42067.1 MAG: tetratricopeptide repeat protein [Reyranella sp.]
MKPRSSMIVLAIALTIGAAPSLAQQGVRVGNCWTDYSGRNHCGPDTTPPRVRGGSGGTTYVPPPPAPGMVEFKRGKDLFNAGRYVDAIAAFQQADRLRPNDANILDWLAESSRRAERHREAIEYGRRVLQINPRDGRAAGGIGYSHYQLGDLKSALAFYQQALQLDLTSADRTITQSSIANIKQELLRETVKVQEKTAQQAIAAQIRKLEDAQQSLDRSMAAMHAARQAFVDQGSLFRSMNDLPDSRDGELKRATLLRAYLKKYPNQPGKWDRLAEVLLKATVADRPAAAEINEAIAAARRAIALKPDEAAFYRTLIIGLAAAKQGDEAIAYARVATQKFKDKDFGGAFQAKIAAFEVRKWGRFAEAERLLDLVASTVGPEKVRDDRAGLRHATFLAAITKGDGVTAGNALAALCKVQATCLDQGHYGELALRDGRPDEGKAAYLAVVVATPPEKRLAAVAQFRDAILKYSNNPADYAEVQSAYIGLMPPGPSDAKAIEQAKLGYVLLRAGQQQQAAAEFKKALTHDSTDPAFYVRTGDILRRSLAEPAEAIRFYERALQLDPNDVAAAARLAAARQTLAPGNPGRTPDAAQKRPPPVATQPGALGEAGALSRASRGADGKIDPRMAAQAARDAFDGGMVKVGSATPVVLGGMPPAASPSAAPSEHLQKDPKWQVLKAVEEKLESRAAEVEQGLAEAERKLETAPPAEKPKVQVEVVKQRDQVTKVRAELQMAKVQTESYRLSVEEQPVPAVEASAGNPEAPPASGSPPPRME